MSMSKVHYETVARILRTNRSLRGDSEQAQEVIDNIVGDMAVAFYKDNPRFDEQRFIDACEMGGGGR